MPGTRVALQRLLLGRLRGSRELRPQLLPKRLALPTLSADPVSSVAYASQEMMLVLVLAGAGALALTTPSSGAVALLAVLVAVNYRGLILAYPNGGGAYQAAREGLGTGAGLVAASALLINYALVAAVSVAAAAAAIVSAVPELAGYRVALALVLLAAVTLAHLREVRRGGLVFMVATYLFCALLAVLVLTGLVRCGLGVGGCPAAPSAAVEPAAVEALTIVLLLRAFALGAVALAGLDSITNSVNSFRYPRRRNAALTLAMITALSATLFLGVSYLASATGVVPQPDGPRTVLAEVALALFGEGVGFYLVQAATVAVLLVAANMGYADFPRLASVLARDRWLPRQFLAHGDRLVFANGVLVLTGAAAVTLALFGASVTRLVTLYVVGVFGGFTLAQAGMARRALRRRDGSWQTPAVLNSVGAVLTLTVVATVVVTRLTAGAWLVLAAVGALTPLLWAVNRHYQDVAARLRRDLAEPPAPRPNHALILLDRVDEAAARSLSYIVSTQPASIRALGVPLPGADLEARWAALAPEVPLEVLQGAEERGTADALVSALHARARQHGPDEFTTAVIPETLSRSWWDQLREHRLALRLKGKLHQAGRVVVTDVTSPVGGPGPYTLEEPAEHHVVVLIAAVNAAALRALSYAETLHGSTVRVLSVSLSPDGSADLRDRWQDWGLRTPLEIIDSPFRSLSATVRAYARGFAPDGRHRIVTCVLPTYRVLHSWQTPLHNQSARLLRSALLFERGVVSTSVPYALDPTADDDAGPADSAAAPRDAHDPRLPHSP